MLQRVAAIHRGAEGFESPSQQVRLLMAQGAKPLTLTCKWNGGVSDEEADFHDLNCSIAGALIRASMEGNTMTYVKKL